MSATMPLPVLRGGEMLADWFGRRVKVKGLINGFPEVLAVGELVGVSEIGVVLAWKDSLTFFPWTAVTSLRLDPEESS